MTSSQTTEATAVSASGKVLLAGGYLVLDQKYAGLVVSTSSRFYTVVRSGSSVVGGERKEHAGTIHVRSPQFESAEWVYGVEIDDGGVVHVVQPDGAQKNKFVHIALQTTLSVVAELRGVEAFRNSLARGLDIVIVGGNDFYSQRSKLAELGLPPRLASLARLPPFAHTGGSLGTVHKTGLGSSAALVTSLVGALLVHLEAVPAVAFTSEPGETGAHGRALAHNAAQLAHCAAQGKVGSGFDVAAAAFGSQRFTRFSPNILAPLMASLVGEKQEGSGKLLPVLDPRSGVWDYRTEPFALPPGTRLMLADVDAGSDTPSLVGKVLAWRKAAGAEADAYWDALGASNDALAAALTRLSALHAQDSSKYFSGVAHLSTIPPNEWLSAPQSDEITKAFIEAHNRAQDIRVGMREMGKLAGVPIEPPEQTALLDACIAQAGVIAGGVPGAGGYDAVWVLVLDAPGASNLEGVHEKVTPQNNVESVWETWKGLDVSPLSATESFEKGLQLVKVSDVPGLSEAIAI